MNVNRYIKINFPFINNNFTNRLGDKIIAHIPNPSENDYKNGFIERYFAQKSNDVDSYIYEIGNDFLGRKELNFYTIVKVRWRLTGNVEQIKQSNFNSIKLHYKEMPKLSLYLPNLLQFAKPN